MINKNYSVKEVADLLKVDERTVRRWIKNGTLPAEKFPKTEKGRWYVKDIDIPAFLRQN